MYILGINAFHADSSACLMKDGEVINAIEEERIKRVKHWAGFPIESIKFCLDDEGITIKEVDHITISRDPSANIIKKAAHSIKNLVKISSIYDRLLNTRKVSSVRSILAKELDIPEKEITKNIHNIEHHRSHMASSFYASPFEEAAILSIDGFGDFSSTMRGIGRGNNIEIIDNVLFPHSLGIFYTAFTQFLGFDKYGDEYKVMGLAAFGKPVHCDKLQDVIYMDQNGLFKLNEKYFRHSKEGVKMIWENGVPEIDPLYSNFFIEKFGEHRGVPERRLSPSPSGGGAEELTQYHKDLAASVQKTCENIIIEMLQSLHQKTGMDSLCLTGGVAQNSVVNGKIIEQTPFKKLYIPSAGHDAGTSIGSALYLYNNILKKPRSKPMLSASLGSRYDNEEIEKILSHFKINYKQYTGKELFDIVTDCIINGGVVGWFQGRAEFGPRALGNRSILADPRRKDASELLNIKIKKRESFRPFAPSVLKEQVGDFFEQVDDVPFMEKVFVIKEEKRKYIPAVTHIDGTGRLQTVDKKNNEKYYLLISEFYRKTNIPMLLNTSFNENEPIVNTPSEALDCYLRTNMDMLVLENYVTIRK